MHDSILSKVFPIDGTASLCVIVLLCVQRFDLQLPGVLPRVIFQVTESAMQQRFLLKTRSRGMLTLLIKLFLMGPEGPNCVTQINPPTASVLYVHKQSSKVPVHTVTLCHVPAHCGASVGLPCLIS